MLKFLEIENVALIDKLSIDFSPNLNVLTGETGAGKSIIIDALNFVIGAKANKSLIKQGESFMKVKAIFSSPFSQTVLNLLNQYDIEAEDELLIVRKMSTDGKSEIKVNGNPLTATMLKNLTNNLIDIHGQHEHQHLLNDKFHIKIIDSFIKNNNLFLQYELKLAELKNILSQIKKLNGSAENQERMLDLLTYQIKEIESAKLQIGEDETLSQKKLAMLNFEKIFDGLNSAINEIDNQNSVIDGLKRSYQNISSLIKFDESFENLSTRLESARFEVIDILEVLKDKKNECNFDQSEFDVIDERLDKIKLLKKKYGSTIEDILLFLNNAKEEYDNILNSKDKLQKTLKEKDLILKDLYEIATKIHNERQEVSTKFEKQLKEQLTDLGMKNSKFLVEISSLPTLDNFEEKIKDNGCDEVRFLFSANAGQNLKPLSEIISGGEASRFMLALKNILAEHDEIFSMVFDEIDTGISGDMGYKVACKLANISKNHQVMSVSHLPQICAMADFNFKVEKYVEDEKTKVSISLLNEKAVLNEISRLSGGLQDSLVSVEHSKELRARCIDFKKNI